MNQNRLKYETQFFIAAILLAGFLRFLNLGEAPLSDAEASWALQALEVARAQGLNSQIIIGPQPAYIFLTSLLFRLFGATNFMARFWPAFAGVVLVFVPFFTRAKIGRLVAVVAVFGLAFDPGLVAVARQAGSPMMALGFGLAAIALWIDRRPIPAGIFAGVALLSGPSIFSGMIGLILGVLIVVVFWSRTRPVDSATPGAFSDSLQEPQRPPWPKAFIAGSLTIMILGTFFLRYPQGLAAWVESLAVYLSGWGNPSGISALRTLAALLIYQPVALLFAFAGVIRWLVFKDSQDSPRSYFTISLCWFLSGLILTLAYPARQASDLVWTLTPLWLMAAWELCHYIPENSPELPAWLHAGLILILSGLFYYTLVSTGGISSGGVISPEFTRLVLLLGILSLGALTSVLVALGWSLETSRLGTAWGILAAGAVYLTAALWGAAFLRPNNPTELWGALPGSGQVELLSDTLDTLSKWNTGLVEYLDVVSLLDAPSLRWFLRDYPNARFLTSLPASERPSIVITGLDQQEQEWAASYRGQDFVWWSWPGWERVLPGNFVDWIAFREAPIQNEKIILWARSDLFPGGVLPSEQSQTAVP